MAILYSKNKETRKNKNEEGEEGQKGKRNIETFAVGSNGSTIEIFFHDNIPMQVIKFLLQATAQGCCARRPCYPISITRRLRPAALRPPLSRGLPFSDNVLPIIYAIIMPQYLNM